MTYTLRLAGSVPCKKNRRHVGRNGRTYFDRPEVGPQIDALQLQAQSQWKREPLERAEIRATFYVRDGCADRDGKYTTLQDVLVKAGVVANDSIKRIPRFSCEAFLYAGEEQVRVELEVL